MTGATPPAPSTLAVPRRGVRRLNRLPLLIVGAVVVLMLGVTFRTIFSAGQKAAQSALKTVARLPASAADVLKNAPAGYEIPPDWPDRPAHAPTVNAAPATPADEPAGPVDPKMTPMAVEARRAAWKDYFEAIGKKPVKRREALVAALMADPAVGNGVSGGTGAGQGNASGMMSAGMSTGSEAMLQQVPGMPQALLAPGVPGAGGYGGGYGGAQQPSPPERQRNFLSGAGSDPSTDYLKNTLTKPISPYELKATDVINGTMVSGLNSDSPGIIKALVSRNVTDHATGSCILVPQGSTLVGTYDNAISYGQRRVVVAWQRIIYPAPGDESLDLGMMPGADQSGYSGFSDRTDHHYLQVFGNALLLSLFSAGAQLSQTQSRGDYYSSQQVIASALGQQLGELGMEYARRGLDIPPTNEIRPGYPFVIMLTKDVAFSHCWQPSSAPALSKMEVTVAR